MESFIKIIRISDADDDPLKFGLDFSNGVQRAEAEIYLSRTFFEKSSKALEEFPRHRSDRFTWENGSERIEDNRDGYFRFYVFTTDSLGQCAIQICYNNKEPLPARQISEFCIHAEPLQINRLGELLGRFASMNYKALNWMVSEGELLQ